MTHSFLLESGIWHLHGHWAKPNQVAIAIKGQITISWKQHNWFKILTTITSDDEPETKILSQCQCQGNLNYEEKSYTYVLQHSLLGNIEGEGRLGLESIVQYYWSVGMAQKRRGFDTFYNLNEDTYYFTSSVLEDHKLNCTMEATLKRQP